MRFEFTDTIPAETTLRPVLLSGVSSADDRGQTFLLLRDDNHITALYEIKYRVHCSPFAEALVADQVLAVGYEEYFYLFNVETNQNVLRLRMEGYFGNLYYELPFFYVADAYGLYCVDRNGNTIWNTRGLAIDGVTINKITDTEIYGSGECDPPVGWVDFLLDKKTGIEIK